MYLAVCKYGAKSLSSYKHTLNDNVYIFDTEDCTVEEVKAIDILTTGIEVRNMLFWDDKFTVTGFDFALHLDFNNNDDRWNFKFDVRGTLLHIEVKTIGSTMYVLCVNNVEVLYSYRGYVFAYAFKFSDYAVLRVITPCNNGEIEWHSIGVGSDGIVHDWNLSGIVLDPVGIKIDMVSEV